jgi:hypothetical protein
MDQTNCPRCNAKIDADDNYCRRCGLRLQGGGDALAASVVLESPPRGLSVADNRWFVLFMLFFILGPLALPMLWRGRAFSRRGKWILTVLIALYTFLVLWLSYYLAVKMIVEPFQRLNSEVFHR